ncbi:MAG TPA: ROK family transcriptional regulator [Aggregatilineales bacterium]|jgi:predicted NBD/HSP70 family sugar kinase|nr:ROK family transcriptional regulator [Aggregatilineales bacterium]
MKRKATREQLKRHNRQLVLRAVYSGAADSRAALALETGLTKPTVSDLVAELIDEGLLVEGGLGESTDAGGKRPTLIRFAADARQVIGVALESHRVNGVLSNLAGQIAAQHFIDLETEYAQHEDIVTLIMGVIDGLIAQLDAPLLCLGVGVPGAVDRETGFVWQSPYDSLSNLSLANHLAAHYHKPVYAGNTGELAALAQFAFGVDASEPATNLATLLVGHTVEIGVAQDSAAHHHGGDISSLILGMNGTTHRLDHYLTWTNVCARLEQLRAHYGSILPPAPEVTYFHVRYAAARGDDAARHLLDELSDTLAQVMAWIIGLLRPDHISLAGAVVNLGESFLEQVAHKTAGLIAAELAHSTAYSLAYSGNLSAIGAVAHALQRELDIL